VVNADGSAGPRIHMQIGETTPKDIAIDLLLNSPSAASTASVCVRIISGSVRPLPQLSLKELPHEYQG